MARPRSNSILDLEQVNLGYIPTRGRASSKSSVSAPIWQTQATLENTNPFSWPNDLTYLPCGYLAIADLERQRVQLYDNFLQCRVTIAQGLIDPFCVTSTLDGQLILTDQRNKCAAKFTTTGKLLMTGGHANFEEPSGIAALPDGWWVCTDTKKNAAIVYNCDGIFVKEFGGKGTGFIQMDWPAYVTTDSKNRIIISDCNNFAVKLFDRSGKYLCRLGGNSKHGKLLFPKGVCVDDRDNIFAVEWGNDSIKMYGPDGRFIQDMLTSSVIQMENPQGIAWKGDNSLVVSCKSPEPGIGVMQYWTQWDSFSADVGPNGVFDWCRANGKYELVARVECSGLIVSWYNYLSWTHDTLYAGFYLKI